MKIICNLMIVIVVVCYSGVCTHAAVPLNKSEAKPSSCHSQSPVEKADTKDSELQTIIINNDHTDPNCCIITLTTATNDNYAALKVFSDSGLSLPPALKDNTPIIEKFRDYSNQHDPPEITLLKSSLLL